jgi:hypothetical protein
MITKRKKRGVDLGGGVWIFLGQEFRRSVPSQNNPEGLPEFYHPESCRESPEMKI